MTSANRKAAILGAILAVLFVSFLLPASIGIAVRGVLKYVGAVGGTLYVIELVLDLRDGP